MVTALTTADDKAVAGRIYVIDVIGFDWNCPQHITPRFTEAEIASAVAPLTAEVERLRSEVTQLRARHEITPSDEGE